MKLTAQEVAAIGAASKDRFRHIISGLHVTPDTVVATDSFGVVAMERVGDGDEQAFEAIIPAELVKAIAPAAKRKMGKDGKQEIAVSRAAGGMLEANAIDGNGMATTWAAREVEGTFPNWRRCHPQRRGHEKLSEMWVDPARLRDLAATMVKMGAKSVRLELFAPKDGEMAPIVLSSFAKESKSPAMVGMLQGMQIQALDVDTPEWLKQIQEPAKEKPE